VLEDLSDNLLVVGYADDLRFSRAFRASQRVHRLRKNWLDLENTQRIMDALELLKGRE
jgi:hypothetical protein